MGALVPGFHEMNAGDATQHRVVADCSHRSKGSFARQVAAFMNWLAGIRVGSTEC